MILIFDIGGDNSDVPLWVAILELVIVIVGCAPIFYIILRDIIEHRNGCDPNYKNQKWYIRWIFGIFKKRN